MDEFDDTGPTTLRIHYILGLSLIPFLIFTLASALPFNLYIDFLMLFIVSAIMVHKSGGGGGHSHSHGGCGSSNDSLMSADISLRKAASSKGDCRSEKSQ